MLRLVLSANGVDEEDLDFDETLKLERRRQQLQRELSRLEAEDADSDRAGPEKPVCISILLQYT